MKQADLHVGNEYAFQTYKPYDAAPLAARVRIVSVDGGGKVTIQVVDPGVKLPKNSWGAKPVKRDERQQVATRDIACPWDEWADRAASVGAKLEARAVERRNSHDDYEQRHADRLVVDADRALQEAYDEEFFDPMTDAEERAALRNAYIEARGLGPYATREEMEPLLVDLPIPVLRDILAANAHRQAGVPGTVASTFIRAAELLETARVNSMRDSGRVRGTLPRLEYLLSDADVEFVNAIRNDIENSGGELLLPPVPPLPSWIDEEVRTKVALFGWLRLAMGDTSGEKLHSPGCTSIRSGPVLLTEHLPWWLVTLESRRLCGRCGGPGARDLVALAGFVAAADVWHGRGRDRIERWQQTAFQRLLSTTAAARAQNLEPDITRTWRIVAALNTNPPADDGWAAYALVAATDWNRLGKEFEQLGAPEQEAARVLARDRMTVLEAALPPSQRLEALPQAVGVNALRQRYGHLKDLLQDNVPQLSRLLFTLPGAY